ncbi:phosphoglycerate kinase [Tumebacillus algifaecis]|uniref:Phosphoglycerate kinase n=1 Tax=Tumebacillus algifaecis TaxID=1214604 RepID=A0A223CWG5_9BACL|nr:phosphoglycerate kinase [Tumebacillus algifaecis]ASS73666.1 phosphoglycerate kinase [Tumebacillus algifaecis]
MNEVQITDIEWHGKRALCRVDLNVPYQNGKITDDTRIRGALGTIEYLIERGAKVILLTHLGYPKGKVVSELRVDPIASRLSELLQVPVRKCDETVGETALREIEGLQPGDVLLLENVRFLAGEESNSQELARQYAELGDVFVLDAFATIHRRHASIIGISTHLPAVSGLLMQRELRELRRVTESPESPFTAIMGGAKVKDKIEVIERLLETTDQLLIGGAIANTFLAAQGLEVGCSLYDEGKIERAAVILQLAQQKQRTLLLPVDVLVTNTDDETELKVVAVTDVQTHHAIVDIGPKTRRSFADTIQQSRLVVWNGAMGIFEHPATAGGTLSLIQALVHSPAYTVIGGGDTLSSVKLAGCMEQLDYLSTGGGAMLKFLEGSELPGLSGLRRRTI